MLVDLARNQGQGPVKIREISHRQGISAKYLGQLIRPLKKAQLVISLRGATGGHLLAKSPEEITLGQIVRILERQKDLVECVGHPERCPMSDDCQPRLAWMEATRVFYDKLDTITIADLVDPTYQKRYEDTVCSGCKLTKY
jgi:Rrf2 family protein